MLKEIWQQRTVLLEQALIKELHAEQALDKTLCEAMQYSLMAGGKRLRPLLTVLCARLLGHKDDGIYDLAITLEMLHAATLLHDDVLDNAVSRANAVLRSGAAARLAEAPAASKVR